MVPAREACTSSRRNYGWYSPVQFADRRVILGDLMVSLIVVSNAGRIPTNTAAAAPFVPGGTGTSASGNGSRLGSMSSAAAPFVPQGPSGSCTVT